MWRLRAELLYIFSAWLGLELTVFAEWCYGWGFVEAGQGSAADIM